MNNPDRLDNSFASMRGVEQDVTDFHTVTGAYIGRLPAIPDADTKKLRHWLIDEEVNKELLPAIDNGDLVGIADGIADAIYVLVGTAVAYGIPLATVWAAVQAANMAKVDPATGVVRKREDGKVLKPEGWTPPDVEGLLRLAGWKG